MMTAPDSHLRALMEETVADAFRHCREGGIPFSAIVASQSGDILGRGYNCVQQHNDPTAHAEIVAIRAAAGAHSLSSIHGAILLASGEPCAMCYMNALHAGISRIYYAVDRDEAAAHGFDYRAGYRLFAIDPRHWPQVSVAKLVVGGCIEPFVTWRTSSWRRS